MTLVGPNGAGKSTILKSLTRQIPIIGGRVEIVSKGGEKRRVSDYSVKDLSKEMSLVLTERIRPELMTCREIVAMGRYPYTGRLGFLTKEDEKKVDEALSAVHATEIAERDFNATSDGQKQRILLARAFCQEPRLLVLDEPTSFLDIRYKLELLSILRKLAREKEITVLMSLHEIDLAIKISDRIICVKGDRIFCEGSPEEVMNEERLQELYGIDNGYFDPLIGSLELPKVVGKPEVFVMSDSGNGIPIYRMLQKQGTPFIAGILYKNDLDYRTARYLAQEVIEEEPFQIIGDRAFEAALEALEQVDRVIDAGLTIGYTNQRMEELRKNAQRMGKLKG